MGTTPALARGSRSTGRAAGVAGELSGDFDRTGAVGELTGDVDGTGAGDRGLDALPQTGAAVAGTRARIALLPAGARRKRARLLDALERAYPVRFEELGRPPHELAEEGYDAVLTLAPPPAELATGDLPASVPRASVPHMPHTSVPHMYALGEERPRDSGPRTPRERAVRAPSEDAVGEVVLAASATLARPLRGARLTDGWVEPLAAQTLAALAPAHTVLATVEGSPAWIEQHAESTGAPLELLAAAPAELEPGESLRERLAPGRCLALLALVHFVRRVASRIGGEEPSDRDGSAWDGPFPASPLHAAFVLDDPNLHAPRYGHLRYAALARHALAHGYHMAIAMPPIDGWYAHPRAVRIFGEHAAQLSLCVHGNDHLGGELGRVRTTADGRALATQALARAAAFERRTGIPFERVMVPPHEQITEAAARGLREAGFAGTCVSRPYPWIAAHRPGPAAALGAGPQERGALAGWEPAELVAGGLPVLLRTGFNAPSEDLVLRAFLGQPLIVYGHHDTLAGGLDLLAETAAAIDALGEVRWGSLAAVARSVVPANAQLPGPPAATSAQPSSTPPLRPRLRPLLRRLASEARDRARV